MGQLFATSDSLGSFDFISNIIELKRYGQSAKGFIEHTLAEPVATTWSESWPVKANIKALVVHEATHFTDCTTTMWGMEFTFRKLRLLNAIAAGDSTEQPLSVFMLNLSELTSHEELVRIGSRMLTDATSMTHTVEIDHRFGPIVYIHYNQSGEPFHTVPLSLLSVLEAHAYANEVLSKIRACDILEECQEKIEYSHQIEQEFAIILADRAQSEYTVLLSLARIHFPELSLKELLVFVSHLCRFGLDLNDLACSELSSYIEASIMSKAAGATICHDLRRGSSRAIIVFKTLLFIHGWLRHQDYAARMNTLSQLRSTPRQVIENFWASQSPEFPSCANFSDLFTFQQMHGLTSNLAPHIDSHILRLCSVHNRRVLNAQPLGLCDLAELQLINLLLEDGTEILVPSGPDLNLYDYLDEHLHIFVKAEQLCRREVVSKFFVRLDGPLNFGIASPI